MTRTHPAVLAQRTHGRTTCGGSNVDAQVKAAKVPAGVMDALTFSDFADLAFRSSSKKSAEAVRSQGADAPRGCGEKGAGVGVKTQDGISAFQAVAGGMEGSSRPGGGDRSGGDDGVDEVLFLGIIDTLVPFNWRKRAEYWAKSLLQRGKNFSVVPPVQPLEPLDVALMAYLANRFLLDFTSPGPPDIHTEMHLQHYYARRFVKFCADAVHPLA